MLFVYTQDVLRSGLLQNGSIAVQDESAGELPIIICDGFECRYHFPFMGHLGLQIRFRISLRLKRYIIGPADLIIFWWAGLVVSVVDAQPGDTIIDCCAAPGGKALNLASRLNGQGMNSQLSSIFNIVEIF